jgi:dipeptidyl aminopeptidase/acylaminoacyl peptidase
MRRAVRLFVAGLIGIAIGSPLVAILVTENALHIYNRPKPLDAAAKTLARRTGAVWSTAAVRAADGIALDGWLFRPDRANGSAVILLHGVADTRLGVMEHARFLVQSGFTVLTPDVRGHGSSGGTLITYGVREAGDVRAWSDWLFQQPGIERLYGLGESMGASILLESLPVEPRFRAVVAECPFVNFEQIAYDRLSQVSGMPSAAFWPIVKLGFLYAGLRYGIDLRTASPERAVHDTRTPVLLIHGVLDDNIPIRHSRQLYAVNRNTVLWEVPGAGHVGSLPAAPAVYIKRVTEWFASHP